MKVSVAMEYILFIFMPVLLCHPIIKSNFGPELKKDEKQYPNGTVVGKYSYTDSEGNPILARYFADDASYGVELISVKTQNEILGNPTMQTVQDTAEVNNLVINTEKPQSIYDFKESNTTSKKSKHKATRSKTEYKTSPDYEIYFQNELTTSQKFGKDKIRVYLIKENRKIREPFRLTWRQPNTANKFKYVNNKDKITFQA